MEEKEIDSKLRKLVLDYHNIYNNEVEINNDVKLIGSDAIDFIDKFKSEFKIDMGDFNIYKYFLPDFNIPFQYTYWKYFKPEKLKKPPITIAHLVEVVKQGKWFEPEEEGT